MFCCYFIIIKTIKIGSNIGRLQAMLSGEFVQYTRRGTKDDGYYYKLWAINDGKDSVLSYTVPVGDPRKHGYWLYHR